MDVTKKYFARSFFFWMVSFLRTLYEHVEIRFIAHTTEAKLVDEQEFFHKGESGGTSCASAYELAVKLIDTEYPTSRWNVYPFHFSDGEDWDAWKTARGAAEPSFTGTFPLSATERFRAITPPRFSWDAFETRA